MNFVAKRFLIPLLPLLFSANVFAQFRLSGKIINYKGDEILKINIPLVYGFHTENSTTIPIKKDGTFAITLRVKAQKFADLIFKRTFYKILLTPCKNVTIKLDEDDRRVKVQGGSAVTENTLLQKIDLEEDPFFMKDGTAFGAMNFTDITKKIIGPYLAMRDKKIALVNGSVMGTNDKKLIVSELKYVTLNYLSDFARTSIKNRALTDSVIIAVFDAIDTHPDVLQPGPQYYAFARNYLGYIETKAFNKIKQDHIKPNEAIPYFGISLDSATNLVNNYGKPYLRWIGSRKFFTDDVTEQFTYQQIISLVYDKDLQQTEALATVFLETFPKSRYVKSVKENVLLLKQLKRQNEANANIKIAENYQNISSIYQVVNQFKGKVIYLDVWGTWCGPCKEELKYIPQLKATFKDKDVVFIYLDMDEEDKDAVWKEFIKVNTLTGMHLRKNRQTIASFWKELLADNPDKEEYYPQYFIFDKNGKLAVSKAKRPSNQGDLYQQITTVLNQN